jgi:uncharacterized protein with GYD domain
MPSYVVLGKWTDQGIRDVKNSPARLERVKHAAQAAGGRVISFYMTMGEYDFTLVLEMPNDEVAARLALGAAMQGNTRSTTMKAFTEDEYRKVVGSLP